VLQKLLGCCAIGALFGLVACSPQGKPAGEVSHFAKTEGAVVVTPIGGPAKKVRLTVVTPKVIHVTAFPTESVQLPASLMAVAKPSGSFDVAEKDGVVTVETAEVVADVAVDTGRVSFHDKQGNVVLSELAGGRQFTPVEVQGDHVYAIRQQFESPPDEAFYGLGQARAPAAVRCRSSHPAALAGAVGSL
jgi:alpha-D-xyloside xylohydrolase